MPPSRTDRGGTVCSCARDDCRRAGAAPRALGPAGLRRTMPGPSQLPRRGQRTLGRYRRRNRKQEKGGSSQRAAKAFEDRRHWGMPAWGKGNRAGDYIRADSAGTGLSPIRNPAYCSGNRPSCDSRTGRKFHAPGVTESRHRLLVRVTPPRQRPQLEARGFRLGPAGRPRIRFLSIGSRLRSTLPSDPASRRHPSASPILHRHQAG